MSVATEPQAPRLAEPVTLFCQGCGNRHEVTHRNTRMPECVCGARWWAPYAPDERKRALVQRVTQTGGYDDVANGHWERPGWC